MTSILLAGGLALGVTGSDVHWGGFYSMVGFYALIYFVGVWAARRSRGSFTNMILAGRSVPLAIGVCTMTATWVGGGYINGTAEAVYASGLIYAQAPWGYALSLVVGGLVFAPIMRRHNFVTMLDPFEVRYGPGSAAVLYLPALTGELFWTAAILTALGTTFGTVLGLNFAGSIILSATIAIAYTMVGGLWAVALTDVVQLVFLMVGLWVVVPVAAGQVGGLGSAWHVYREQLGNGAPAGLAWWAWWDSGLMLVFGGIPWHVYFQRVLASRDEATARRLSVLAGLLCLVAAVPPVIIGVIGRSADWHALTGADPVPALILPQVLRYLTPPVVATVGLGALAAAVMSSVDSSILSASSMAAWNVYRPLIRPDADAGQLTRLVQRAVLVIGLAATLIALKVQSVYALWFLCSDFVYCILFPQLLTALFDRRANRTGAIAGMTVSFILRLGGGEPVLGIPGVLPYPTTGPDGSIWFPFRTVAMVAGLVAITVVSRLTHASCPPRPLRVLDSRADCPGLV